MNSWKVVWNAYYGQSTRRAYLKELVRLSSWPLRISFVLAAILFLFGVGQVFTEHRRDWPWQMILGEISILLLVEHVRTARFATAYGSIDSNFGPAENEEQRGHRFLMFRKALQEKHLTASHVRDLFEIVQAKEELESQHNIALNKFAIFISGLLTSAAIALIRGLQTDHIAWLLFWISIAALLLAPLFWILPTRKGRLKELKYFMVLYCRNAE